MNAWIRILFTLLGVLLWGCAGAAEQHEGAAAIQSRIALVIGNSHYVDAVPLKNPENDANDMCAALTRLGFDVICKLDVATKRDFKDAIFEFTGKINPRTVALFYFAGHGLQVDGINYLIPTKAVLRTRSDIEDEGVQVNYLMNELEARQAALNLFFLDACRNNPLANPVRGYVPMLGMASQLYSPRNSIIAMSTGPGQLSLDGSGRNGTFTKNLLQNINTPRQSVEDMLKAANSGTQSDAKRSGLRQDPQITLSYADRFCMAGCGDPNAPRDAERLASKTAELNRLETTIAETKAKQAELDAQQALLLKKRAELDELRLGLENAQSKNEELARRRAEVSQREQELAKLNGDIKASTDKLSELEAVRLALVKKQDEVERMRKTLALQQAKLDAADKEIRTRAIKPPEKEKEKDPQPVTIPAF